MLIAAIAASGCATDSELATMPPLELCARGAGVQQGFNSLRDYWQSAADRGIDCSQYAGAIEQRRASVNAGMASAAAGLQMMQQSQPKPVQEQRTQQTCYLYKSTSPYSSGRMVCN